jgi:hypothetical protein
MNKETYVDMEVAEKIHSTLINFMWTVILQTDANQSIKGGAVFHFIITRKNLEIIYQYTYATQSIYYARSHASLEALRQAGINNIFEGAVIVKKREKTWVMEIGSEVVDTSVFNIAVKKLDC